MIQPLPGATSSIDHGTGLPQFLRFLATLPAPDPVARALRLGPFEAFDAAAVSLTRVNGEVQELIGTHGFTGAEVDGYTRVPLSIPTPFNLCVRHAETRVDEIEAITSTFVALEHNAGLWQGLMDRFGIGQVISVPIVFQGAVIGVFGGVTRSKRSWTSSDFSLLEGISAAIGLWMTHPESPAPRSDRLTNEDSGLLFVTDRQKKILELVEAGRSNSSIAMNLGYSVSTVKQELQRTMRGMGVNTRLEAAQRARSLGLLDSDDPS